MRVIRKNATWELFTGLMRYPHYFLFSSIVVNMLKTLANMVILERKMKNLCPLTVWRPSFYSNLLQMSV